MLKSCETARFVLESRSSSPPPFDHNLLQQLPRRAPPHSDEGSADLFCFATICCIFSPVYSQKDTRLISMSIFSRKQPGTSCFLLGFPSSIAHQQLEACLNSLPFSCQCSKVFCQENSYDSTLNGSASWHNLLLVLKSWRKKPPLKLTHPLINHSVTLFSTARSGPLSSSTTPPRSSWGSPSQITDLGMAWWIHFW